MGDAGTGLKILFSQDRYDNSGSESGRTEIFFPTRENYKIFMVLKKLPVKPEKEEK
jgi:hypothetical protein